MHYAVSKSVSHFGDFITDAKKEIKNWTGGPDQDQIDGVFVWTKINDM